jgi:hypothetical protein
MLIFTSRRSWLVLFVIEKLECLPGAAAPLQFRVPGSDFEVPIKNQERHLPRSRYR